MIVASWVKVWTVILHPSGNDGPYLTSDLNPPAFKQDFQSLFDDLFPNRLDFFGHHQC